MTTARKNRTPEEFRDPLFGVTGPMIASATAEQMRKWLYGTGGGRQPIPGRKERLQQIWDEWHAQKKS